MSNTNQYLEQLENEAIYILRETAAQFEKPALLFSGGKDSIVLVHLALKAFRPACCSSTASRLMVLWGLCPKVRSKNS